MAKRKPLEYKNIDANYLESVKPGYLAKGFTIPKWVTFCETLLADDWSVKLHESQSTVSRYIYVNKNGHNFKVRFSNHKPSKTKEEINDSDFYVGISHFGVMRTEDVIKKLNQLVKL